MAFLVQTKDVSAHRGPRYHPDMLPSCTARILTCEVPVMSSGPNANGMDINRTADERCVDGMGVTVSCDSPTPFLYLAVRPADDKIVAAVADMEALGPAPCVNEKAGEFPCHQVDRLSFLPLSDIGGGSGNDIWGWTDSTTGKEYAIVGRTNGTAFVDISDPENPIYLGNLPNHAPGGSSIWRDIKVYQDHAYIVADKNRGHGLQIFDLTQLSELATSATVTPPVIFSETAHYDEFGDSHNIVINEASGYAYAVGSDTCAGGLHMIDIRSPTNPTFAGCFAEDGYTHDAQCVLYHGPDLTYRGSEICFNSNGGGGRNTVTIVDVSDKEFPTMLARQGYDTSGYTHQGWLTEDHRYFLLGDELDEFNKQPMRTLLWDVSDLDHPTLLGYHTDELNTVDHNLYVRGRHVFQANYSAGLHVLDVSAIASGQLKTVATFDTYPENDKIEYRSAWSVYPYFDSGVVIVSTISEGLFVLRPNLPPDFTIQAQNNVVEVCNTPQVTTSIRFEALSGYQGNPSLRLTDVPSGVTAQFASDSLTIPGNGVQDVALTLDIDAQVEGVHTMNVIAEDRELSDSALVYLTVDRLLPGSGTATLPLGLTSNGGTFVWAKANGARSYTFELATDPAFTNLVDRAVVTEPTYATNVSLLPKTLYYWRIRAHNACGAGNYSETASFTIPQQEIFLPIVAR